jgi:hypothetical protein
MVLYLYAESVSLDHPPFTSPELRKRQEQLWLAFLEELKQVLLDQPFTQPKLHMKLEYIINTLGLQGAHRHSAVARLERIHRAIKFLHGRVKPGTEAEVNLSLSPTSPVA